MKEPYQNKVIWERNQCIIYIVLCKLHCITLYYVLCIC